MPYNLEKQVKFYVVRVESPYNAILGRPALATFKVVSCIPHLKLKFLTKKGVREMRGDQKTFRIIMLDDMEKEQEYEETEGVRRKRADLEPIGSR